MQIPVHAMAPKCGTHSIRYVTLHFRDRCCTASLRYRNRAEITRFLCVNRSPIQYCFRAGAKAIWDSEKKPQLTIPSFLLNRSLPWVPEVFLACGGNFPCWQKPRVAKPREKTGNRARKVSGTQGNRSLASERYIVTSTKCLATIFLDQ